jgi:hypothetical protein
MLFAVEISKNYGKFGSLEISRRHFPMALTAARMMIITMKPAPETAAAVSCPLIAEATERPAKTRRIINIMTTPRGVFTAEMIEPERPPPLDILMITSH